MTIQYNAERDISDDFLRTVESWIAASGEVFVVLRYLAMAGSKGYALIGSAEELAELLDVVPKGTDIIVFRDPQLPFRETVTAEWIAQIAESVPTWDEYLFVVLSRRSASDPRLDGELGSTAAELRDDLDDHLGERVAVGPCPPFMEADGESMISRSKGGVDGPR